MLYRLCIAIILSLFAVSSIDASLFGVSSSSATSLSYDHWQTSSSYIMQLRGGDDGDDVPAFRPYLPYTLAIRDSIMIAHSFHGHPSFGPAGGLHGATYTVDVEFASSTLHPACNWVIDICVASDLVAQVLKK